MHELSSSRRYISGIPGHYLEASHGGKIEGSKYKTQKPFVRYHSDSAHDVFLVSLPGHAEQLKLEIQPMQ